MKSGLVIVTIALVAVLLAVIGHKLDALLIVGGLVIFFILRNSQADAEDSRRARGLELPKRTYWKR